MQNRAYSTCMDVMVIMLVFSDTSRPPKATPPRSILPILAPFRTLSGKVWVLITRLNPQGRVAPLGAFAWMSQKRIWIGRLRHTRQIENHHKKDQILVSPEDD